jgi:integrase/recombinase XerD
MKDNSTSQNYQKGNLKAMVHFADHIGVAMSFYDVDYKQVVRSLGTKIKPEQIDSDKKWITIWNDYLWETSTLFFSTLLNKRRFDYYYF